VRYDVRAGRLSMGHARAILALPREADQRNIAREIIAKNWSVRETEQMVTRALAHPDDEGAAAAKKPGAPREVDVHTRAAQDKLRLTFGTKVDIARRGKGGEIRIWFRDEDELIRIYEILVGE
jgi:ParB family chromosome partitioning protein